MPALTKVRLVRVQLTEELAASPAILSKSLKEFKMSGGFGHGIFAL